MKLFVFKAFFVIFLCAAPWTAQAQDNWKQFDDAQLACIDDLLSRDKEASHALFGTTEYVPFAWTEDRNNFMNKCLKPKGFQMIDKMPPRTGPSLAGFKDTITPQEMHQAFLENMAATGKLNDVMFELQRVEGSKEAVAFKPQLDALRAIDFRNEALLEKAGMLKNGTSKSSSKPAAGGNTSGTVTQQQPNEPASPVDRETPDYSNANKVYNPSDGNSGPKPVFMNVR